MDDDQFSSIDSLRGTPESDMPLTVSPADTSLNDDECDEQRTDEKRPAKKRKSWGQELPTPKTNLPPRYVPFRQQRYKNSSLTNTRKRAKTDDEKEQRRIERVLRNRAAAQTSRERKRLEMEKLENEKIQMEQQNQFLLSRLSQMEVENNRLNQQVIQLSAEARGSRSVSPKPASPAAQSPTLTPTLFKQEGDELPMERIPFPTPSVTDYSPTLKPSTLAESSDATQHPAAMLCDLQCPSLDSKELEAPSLFSTSAPAQNLTLHVMLQLLFLTMTSTAYSTVIRPLSLILRSLKMGSPLEFSTTEIYQHFPLILWLISTPNLSPSMTSTSRPTVFRMRLLARLLACSPALARPLRDATGRALQLAVSDSLPRGHQAAAIDGVAGRQNWESLLTMALVIDCLQKKPGHLRRQRNTTNNNNGLRLARVGKLIGNRSSSRRSNSNTMGETLSSLLMGKEFL